MNAAARAIDRTYTGSVSAAVIFSLVGLTILAVAIDHWFVNRPR